MHNGLSRGLVWGCFVMTLLVFAACDDMIGAGAIWGIENKDKEEIVVPLYPKDGTDPAPAYWARARQPLAYGSIEVRTSDVEWGAEVQAEAGREVLIRVRPDADYGVLPGSVKYIVNTNEIPASGSGGAYFFTMPGADVEISAEFGREHIFVVFDGGAGDERVDLSGPGGSQPYYLNSQITVRISGSGYMAQQWLFDGTDITDTARRLGGGSLNGFTARLSAFEGTDWPMVWPITEGIHNLTAVVTNGTLVYTKTITFRVALHLE